MALAVMAMIGTERFSEDRLRIIRVATSPST